MIEVRAKNLKLATEAAKRKGDHYVRNVRDGNDDCKILDIRAVKDIRKARKGRKRIPANSVVHSSSVANTEKPAGAVKVIPKFSEQRCAFSDVLTFPKALRTEKPSYRYTSGGYNDGWYRRSPASCGYDPYDNLH